MKTMRRFAYAGLLTTSIGALAVHAVPASAQRQTPERSFDIPAQPLASALLEFSRQSDVMVMVAPDLAAGRRAPAVKGAMPVNVAIGMLLRGSGFRAVPNPTGGYRIERSAETSRKSAIEEQSADNSTNADIVVTGTNIRGKENGASPLRIFTREEIDRSGVATLQQFFQKLPQNAGSGANAGNVANSGFDRDVTVNDGRGSGINLRGLGTGTTLTLLNGRRITASNQFQYVDISLLPLSAVERVEVLTDGASAIYGTDAIGGVVNIILRKDFDGLETRARFGSVTTGGLKEYQLSQTAGAAWKGGRALLSYEFLRQDNLKVTDKEFSRNAPFKPYDLYPQSGRHSVYGSIAQAVTPDLLIELNGIYAKRNVKATRGTANDFEINVPSTEQYDLSAGLTYDLPASWQARLNGAIGKSLVVNTGTLTTTTGTVSAASVFRISSNSRYVDLAVDGPLMALPGGDVRVALGATYRRDEYRNASTSGTQSRPIVRGARNVTSTFGEVVIPLVGQSNRRAGIERLESTVAVRFDDYSDFGSTLNPKFGVVWETAPGFLLRGTYGTSFRAPVFQDLEQRNTAIAIGNLPNPAAAGGRTIAMLVQGGNAGLDAEKATSWTAGIELRPKPVPRLAVKLNYYHISYRDRIDRGFRGLFPTLFTQDTAPYASIITVNPSQDLIAQFKGLGQAGALFQLIRVGPFAVPAGQDERNVAVILDNRLRNNAATFQQGIDFDTTYAFAAGESQIGLNFAGQVILSSTQRLTPTSPEVDVLNRTFLPADFKFRTGADFSRGPWSVTASLNYVGAYRDPLNTADNRVEPWKTIDLNIRYTVPSSAPSLLRNSSIALDAQNLFDVDPPFVVVTTGAGFDPVNANPLGRFVSLTVTKRW